MSLGRQLSTIALLALTMEPKPFAEAIKEANPWVAPVVYYDPSEIPKRGGRWRAVQRWRNWWARERTPAMRQTARRHLYV